MSILMKYIWKNELPQELRAVLISLLINVHIDSKPRTERKAPLYIKKLAPDQRNTIKSRQDERSTNEFPVKVKKMNFHDVVVDITKIKAFTKTLQSKLTKPGVYSNFDKEESKSEIELKKMTSSGEMNSEIIEEFIKEDDTIKEEEMKVLKEKILEFLDNDMYSKNLPQTKHKSSFLKEKEILFNDFLLNIVQLIRKLILFECFTPIKMNAKDFKGKSALFGGKKDKIQPDFAVLVKNLLCILEFEGKGADKKKRTNVFFHKKSLANQFMGKIGDVTETMKNFTTGLGQIFFTKNEGVNKENPTKKKKRESVVNFKRDG